MVSMHQACSSVPACRRLACAASYAASSGIIALSSLQAEQRRKYACTAEATVNLTEQDMLLSSAAQLAGC